jgi:transcriptional regulator with XRE-family HTH domain
MNPWHRIDGLRQKQGLNLKQLAEIAGVVPSAVANWKAGSSIRSAALSRIAKHFNVSVDQLIGADPPDEMVRERPQAYAGNVLCGYPKDCDLVARFDSQDARLDMIEAQLETLVGLLGGALKKGLDGAPRYTAERQTEKRRAG